MSLTNKEIVKQKKREALMRKLLILRKEAEVLEGPGQSDILYMVNKEEGLKELLGQALGYKLWTAMVTVLTLSQETVEWIETMQGKRGVSKALEEHKKFVRKVNESSEVLEQVVWEATEVLEQKLRAAQKQKAGDLWLEDGPSSVSVIAKPPGSTLSKILKFLYTKKTYDIVFDPIVADLQTEYFECLDNKEYWKARWTRVIYLMYFVKAGGLHSLLSLVKNIIDSL